MNYPLSKSEIYATAGTLAFCIIMILLLCLMGIDMKKPKITENEIEINFGNGTDGTPAPVANEQNEASQQQTSVATASTPDVTTPANSIQSISQVDPSIAIAEQNKRKEQKQKIEALRQEQQRINAEKQAEVARINAQRKATAAKNAKTAKASALAMGAFGKGGSAASGSGNGEGGDGNTPGNPVGHGTSNGNIWSLTNRGLTNEILKPAYVGDQEGTVIITITVDKLGNVIGTDIGKGTTITDQALRNECKAKARKIKFSQNKKLNGNQIGSITYKFKER